jgi:hypothetical protein
MTAVFREMQEFQEKTIKETTERLKKCETLQEINKLNQQFHILIDRFNFNTAEEMERAALEFDHGKKVLSKSRIHGNHMSAWIIIKDSGAFDPSTITNLMEHYKQALSEEVSSLQKQVTLSIRNTVKEFEYYQADWDLVSFSKSKFRKMRTLLQSEMIWCEIELSEFKKSIEAMIIAYSKVETWSDILDCIEKTQLLQSKSFYLGQYLSCSTKTNFIKLTSYKSNLNSYKAWKKDYLAMRSPAVETNEANEKEELTEPSAELHRESSRLVIENEPFVERRDSQKLVSLNLPKIHSIVSKPQQPQKDRRLNSATSQNDKTSITRTTTSNQEPTFEKWDLDCPLSERNLEKIFSQWIETCRKLLVDKYEVILN